MKEKWIDEADLFYEKKNVYEIQMAKKLLENTNTNNKRIKLVEKILDCYENLDLVASDFFDKEEQNRYKKLLEELKNKDSKGDER